MQKVEIYTGPAAPDPKAFFPDAKHVITYAFSITDPERPERHYFRFDDPINMPYDRAMKALVYFKELDMNVDREFLELHTQAFDNALKQPVINVDTLLQLKKLNDHLKVRLTLPKEPDRMYKMAAITFFDQHENPYVYEFKYGEGKIRNWKKNISLPDFFLQMPLMELIPYLKHAGENLEMFSQMTLTAIAEHSADLSPMLSE